jgi:hypothetical protein
MSCFLGHQILKGTMLVGL